MIDTAIPEANNGNFVRQVRLHKADGAYSSLMVAKPELPHALASHLIAGPDGGISDDNVEAFLREYDEEVCIGLSSLHVEWSSSLE